MVGSPRDGSPSASLLLYERSEMRSDLMAGPLSELDYVELVGAASSLEEATEGLERRRPDLLVASRHVPDDGALRLARRLRGADYDTALVVVGLADRSAVLEFLEAGATGYVLEDEGMEDLDATLRAVLADRLPLEPDVAFRVTDRLADLAHLCQQKGLKVGRLDRLTSREREVLTWLGERLSNREIADRLHIEVSTVKFHVHNILEKLEVANRREAARYLLLADEEERS